jgi:hypothetical protein
MHCADNIQSIAAKHRAAVLTPAALRHSAGAAVSDGKPCMIAAAPLAPNLKMQQKPGNRSQQYSLAHHAGVTEHQPPTCLFKHL